MRDFIEICNKKGYMYLLFVFYIFLVIFTPYLNIGNRDNFEITFIVTLIFAVFIPTAFKKLRYHESSVLNVMLSIMVIILLLDTVSILNFIRVNRGLAGILANIIPNLKVGLYILIIIGFYSFNPDNYKYNSFLYRFMPVLASAVAIVGIFQRFNVLNFNNWFTKYYISSYSGRVLIEVLKENEQWSRVLGTLSNPNFFGLEIIILLIFITSNIIFSYNSRNRALNIAIAILLFMTLIFSQSRTALVALVLVFFYIMIIQALKGGAKSIFKYLIITVGIIVLSLLLIKFLNLNYLFDAIKNGTDTRSVTQRITMWKDAFSLFKLHPVIGIGPVIGKYSSVVDNEYFHILRNYGILGLLGHLSFYIYIFIATFKDIFSRDNNPALNQYAFAVNCSILAVLVENITLATFYHWRNFVLLLFICCMWAKAKNMNKMAR